MTKTMLLIDADNISTDVMEQAVSVLLQEHGALHVRRAYCTAESALKHQQLFKRLGIRPMVNLAAGKNSTDIAMAVDAMHLAMTEQPDVIAIASSDSDFAPLVMRLREKGCRVVGIGQQGKTGDETQAVYDQFTVLAHRSSKPAPARKVATSRTRGRAQSPAPAPAPEAVAPAPAPTPSPAPAPAAPAARKTTRRKAAAAPAPTPPAPAAEAVPDKLRQILMSMPELVRGDTLELRVAADRLREAGLLSKSGSSTKVFGAYAERFELLPAKNPNKVRLKA
jgi:uncharacterized protein (TIGR00288 family)